jgi:hypothetical protein
MLRKRRVRVHLRESPGEELPSVEGLLLSKWGAEIVIGLPELHLSPEGVPARLASRQLVIPRERVAFWEII